jgi:hypothetical protein
MDTCQLERNPHTLVSAGVFEQDHLALLEMETSLLREEQVGAFDNVLEVRFAIAVNESSHV